MEEASCNHQNTSENVWLSPLSLEEGELPTWPQKTFPEPFGNFVKELSRSTETPVELATMLTLAAVATAAQKGYQVQIKPDYAEPVNLWTLTALPPASRKSRVYSEVTQPLRKWEFEQKKRIEPLIQARTSKRKTCEARIKEMRAKAAKEPDELKYQQLERIIEQMECELPEIPTSPQIWTGDVTPEQLGTIMAVNGDAMGVLSDEGGIFDILSGLYSDGRANIDLFLQAHAGSSVRVDRGSRPPIFMENPVLSLGLTVQPEVIKGLTKNKTFRGRGLLGRFLFVMPPSNIGSRTLTESPMSEEQVYSYGKALTAILDGICPLGDNVFQRHTLYLTPEAYSKWMEYAVLVEKLMGEDIAHLSHITDWAGKLLGAIARIAALIHIMRYAHHKPWEKEISHEDMAASVKIGHALTAHALRIFDLLQRDPSLEDARTIYRWLCRERLQRFTARECLRAHRRLKKPELRVALNLLKEHEILREFEEKPLVGRKSEIFEVNPHIHKS